VTVDAGWHRSFSGVVRRTYEAAWEDKIPFLASALSFDLLLTAVPFVILLLGVVGYLVQQQVTLQQIDVTQLIDQFLPGRTHLNRDDTFAWLDRLFLDIVQHRGRLTLIGVPLFLWFSTRLFASLRAALNEVFDTEEQRPWVWANVVDAGMVAATGSLFLANSLLSAGVSFLEAWTITELGDIAGLHWFWAFSLELLAFVFGIALFFLLFKVLPSRHIAWRTALVASLFCAFAFEVAKQLFALYVTRFATFDRLTSDANFLAAVLFLLWIHYTAVVFLLGGEVAETYDLVRLRRKQRVWLA
jgi:membrane protein